MDRAQPTTRGSGCGRSVFWLVLLVGPCPLAIVMAPGTPRPMNDTRCKNNLRQLALAAIQYADDKRVWPTLPGGYDSDASTRTTRGLLWYGYHDNPEGFICPSSYDVSQPVAPGSEVQEDLRRWFWQSDYRRADPKRSPFGDGAPDPTLRETEELSYGWFHTPGAAPAFSGPTRPLAADRALRREGAELDLSVAPGDVGNHDDRLHVVFSDASVRALPPSASAAGAYTYLDALSGEDLAGRAALPAPGRLWRDLRDVLPPLCWLLALVWSGWAGWGRRGPLPPSQEGDVAGPRARKQFLTPDVVGVGKTPLGDARTNAAGKPVLTLSPNQRCPYCHDRLDPQDDLVACLACRTPLHRACAQEGQTCGSLGCAGRGRG